MTVLTEGSTFAGARRISDDMHVLIVGGGASGVLLAAQLLRRKGSRFRVTLIERREMLGCGVAYSTSNASHLLNTRASNMSAFPDEPEHFLDWLRANHDPEIDGFSFVSRGVYGKYMAGLLAPWRGGDRLSCVRQDCVRLEEPEDGGVVAHLANGTTIRADVAVLATGHALPDEPDGLVAQPWAGASKVAPHESILIVGSGLTMVDQVMSLLDAGHRGEIVAVSRRGLLPQPHEPSAAAPISAGELPIGHGAAETMRWLRRRVARHVARGGNWRDVVDGLRPHMQTLWRAAPLTARKSFLRHGCAWWEVHRHRMPPASFARLRSAMQSGRLKLWRGSFHSAWRDEQGVLRARIELKQTRHTEDPPFAKIIDCRGIRRDPEAHASPLIAELLASGRARIDPLRLGLDVGAECDVLRPDGSVSGRLFAIGPASRAAFWEITAIPDIGEQASRVARQLVQDNDTWTFVPGGSQPS
jgi:uncharacterized NAD(P)/FAD-binding protein YdhS